MYILELINKIMKAQKQKQAEALGTEFTEETEVQRCEHLFAPVDSTGETLACTKCGLVVKKAKNINSMSID